MSTLEFKHIAPYLPYDLAAIDEKENIKLARWDIQTYTIRHVGLNFLLIEQFPFFKPLLRPMPDLFKEIEREGEKVCVAKIIKNLDDDLEWWDESKTALHYPDTGEFCITNSDALDYEFLDYIIVQTLFKYHFDVFGLIEKGLAEPIKTKEIG